MNHPFQPATIATKTNPSQPYHIMVPYQTNQELQPTKPTNTYNQPQLQTKQTQTTPNHGTIPNQPRLAANQI